MKINKQRSAAKKKFLIIANIVAILAIISLTYWFAFEKPQQNSSDQHPKVSQQDTGKKEQADKNIKNDVSTEEQSKSDYINNAIDQEKNNTSSAPTPAASSISLSAVTESDIVIVRTSIGNTSAGTCSLKITNSGTTKEYSADILYQPQNSSCAGFSVPVSDIGHGNWKLRLAVTSNNQTATKEITYTVK